MDLNNLEVHPNGHSFTATDEGWLGQRLEVFAKWDGCMQIQRRFTRMSDGEDDIDNIHICDINHFIEFLQAVRDEGVKRFPDEWAMPEVAK